MKRALTAGLLSLAAALGAVGVVATADETPAAKEMKPQSKIDHPFATGLVGDWAVKTEGEGPTGPMSGKGTAKFELGVADTAILESYESDVMGGFHGHGVMKVSEDGKTLRLWWFDSFGAEPVVLSGPLTDTSAEVTGKCPEGVMDISWKKVDGGYDFSAKVNGKQRMTDTYRRGTN